MNRSKSLSFLPVLLLAALSLTACSGPKGPCTVNCGSGGNATVSFTLAAVPFMPPPGTSILSFALTLSSVQLTPSSGTVVNIPLNAATYVVDLTRLQSDSAFLGQVLAKVPAGTYNEVALGVMSAVVTYCTDLGGTSGCDAASVKQVSQAATTPATSSFSATLTSGEKTAIQIQFKIANAITISTTQAQVVSKVDLTAANVLTASTLPPTASSLATGQLDFVEDITGMVTAASSTSVTVQTSKDGSITAAINQSSFFGSDCVTTSGTACPPTVGQFASIDTALNSDGTFALLVYDPIAPTNSDWIEGMVSLTPSSTTQFQIVTNDINLASSNSLIGANLLLGDPVQVTLSSVPPVQPFVVDSKGLFVVNTPFTSGSTDASNIIPGQTVALHVTKFTAKNGTTTPAAVIVDTVVLRFTRVAGSVSNVPGPTFNIQSLPPFFGPTAFYNVQLSIGSPSTNYDGVSSATGLTVGHTAAMRALYFGPLFTPAFSAAKVRQF